MLSFANLLARNTWFLILHWMRRPWMRRLHLMPMQKMVGDRRTKFYTTYKNQNRLARRIGLPLLKSAFFLLLASALLQLTLMLALTMNERGWLTPPQLDSHRLKDG